MRVQVDNDDGVGEFGGGVRVLAAHVHTHADGEEDDVHGFDCVGKRERK